MIILITAVLLSLGFAYLATQNTTGVTLFAGGYAIESIPVYLLILGSLLLGLFTAWFLSTISSVASFMTIRKKDGTIHKATQELEKKDAIILALRGQLEHFAIENSTLEESLTKIKEKTQETKKRPSLTPDFSSTLRHA
ncbi:MAG: hypothetical protein RLZZ455_885 [Candidatus Parcubacteria bacterium]|jgi:uncharacterized integral membrane protein